MKQRIKVKCICGKDISGFSNHHAQKNIKIHLFSREHIARKELMNIEEGNIINLDNLSNKLIIELLANHPFMIEDIREIGRVQKNMEEREYEKKIMVS